jgi:curli biogenesis system outer membrane secretion channel CsgG
VARGIDVNAGDFMKTNWDRKPMRVAAGRERWIGRFCAGLLAWCVVFGAWAQTWGLQLRDAPSGNAAEVVSVAAGSPAAAAGIRSGDWVTQAQNFLVRNAAEFQNIVRLSEGRGTLLLRVSRDGWEKELNLMATAAPPPQPQKAWIGLHLADPPLDASGRPTPGAAVTGTAPGGPAAQAGLRPADLLTQIDGRPILNAAEFAALVGDWPSGRALRLTVLREGWTREVTLVPGSLPAGGTVPQPSAMQPAAQSPSPSPPTSPSAPPAARFAPEVRAPSGYPATAREPAPATQPQGNKALVSIGDFQVKAATANQSIGDGLREMLVTALYNSGSYAVVERMDLQGLAAEQALSRSRMARQGSAVPEQRMDVADIIVYGAVTEFEGEAKGSAAQVGVPSLPLTFGRDAKTAHMAIDVRVVDVASGRILGAQRIAGDAKSSQTRIGAEPTARGVGIPVGLGMFQNTPMEYAIRSCVEKAVAYVSATVPSTYFRHR